MSFLFFLCLFWAVGIFAANDCQPVTWPDPPEARQDGATAAIVFPRAPILESRQNGSTLQPGQVNCRFHGRTYDKVNYYSCKELADTFLISVDEFFVLNPTLRRDCSNIVANTQYCVKGFLEPLRSTNGRCGPQHNNATCLGTAAQCCNAVTFICGSRVEDCEDGSCYEGACPGGGDKFYSTDGTCGKAYGDRLCAGKWGDCCNMSGKCGTGTAFCAAAVCQSGNCDWPWRPSTTASTTRTTSTSTRASTTSTASTASTKTTTATSTTGTPPVPVGTQQCSTGVGPEGAGYTAMCQFTCAYGFCPPPCICTPGTPRPPLPLTGVRGYAHLDMPADWGPLCDYACAHGGGCPPSQCVTTPYSTTKQPGTVCVRGTRKAGSTVGDNMCEFCCRYGVCGAGNCVCDLYGTAITVPVLQLPLYRTCPTLVGN